MSEMKMSQVFNLPLQATYEKDYSDEYNHHICDSTGDILLPCIPDDVDQEFIVEAVNNHDRLVEEIAELQAALELMILQFESDHNCEYEYKVIKSSKNLLAKLNQEGEG